MTEYVDWQHNHHNHYAHVQIHYEHIELYDSDTCIYKARYKIVTEYVDS